MGDEAPPEEEPLLVADAQRVWDDIEDGSNSPAITVQQLIKNDPDHVIDFIAKKGVTKLGEFKIEVRGWGGSCSRSRCAVFMPSSTS
jgi:hypothetical protein